MTKIASTFEAARYYKISITAAKRLAKDYELPWRDERPDLAKLRATALQYRNEEPRATILAACLSLYREGDHEGLDLILEAGGEKLIRTWGDIQTAYADSPYMRQLEASTTLMVLVRASEGNNKPLQSLLAFLPDYPAPQWLIVAPVILAAIPAETRIGGKRPAKVLQTAINRLRHSGALLKEGEGL